MVHPISDTIAAVATPSGSGAIAVIRLSGERAREVARRVVRSRVWESPGQAWRVGLGVARSEGQQILDQVLVLDMPGPRSYTGEDVVELQCHGGGLVTERLLRAVIGAGARLAEPGEFTRRAFINGRIDLTQAEAVADIIAASGEAALQLASRQLSGALGKEIRRLRATLIDSLALIEAALDFPAEELGDPDLAQIDAVAAAIEEVRGAVARLLASYPAAHAAYNGGRVVLVGKPNVGKSSLLNALVGSDRALVTPLAGTTRDVVEGEVRLAGIRLVVADTAGIGVAATPIEVLSMERTRAAIEQADLVAAVFDASAPLSRDDLEVVRAVERKRTLIVANKKDLCAAVKRAQLLALLPEARVVPTSARTGEGLGDLRRALAEAVPSPAGLPEGVVVFATRHRLALEAALEALAKGAADLAGGQPPELVAQDLREAADELGAVTGEVVTEDVLERVFARFCVGK